MQRLCRGHRNDPVNERSTRQRASSSRAATGWVAGGARPETLALRTRRATMSAVYACAPARVAAVSCRAEAQAGAARFRPAAPRAAPLRAARLVAAASTTGAAGAERGRNARRLRLRLPRPGLAGCSLGAPWTPAEACFACSCAQLWPSRTPPSRRRHARPHPHPARRSRVETAMGCLVVSSQPDASRRRRATTPAARARPRAPRASTARARQRRCSVCRPTALRRGALHIPTHGL